MWWCKMKKYTFTAEQAAEIEVARRGNKDKEIESSDLSSLGGPQKTAIFVWKWLFLLLFLIFFNFILKCNKK